jgi:hypothetical protein
VRPWRGTAKAGSAIRTSIWKFRGGEKGGRGPLIRSFQVEDNRKNKVRRAASIDVLALARRKEADELEAEEQHLASIKHRRAISAIKGDLEPVIVPLLEAHVL